MHAAIDAANYPHFSAIMLWITIWHCPQSVAWQRFADSATIIGKNAVNRL
jgi:hypothetical protein